MNDIYHDTKKLLEELKKLNDSLKSQIVFEDQVKQVDLINKIIDLKIELKLMRQKS